MNDPKTIHKKIEHHEKIIQKEKQKLIQSKKSQCELHALINKTKKLETEIYNNRGRQIKSQLTEKETKLQQSKEKMRQIKFNGSSVINLGSKQYLTAKKQYFKTFRLQQKLSMEIKLLNIEREQQEKMYKQLVQLLDNELLSNKKISSGRLDKQSINFSYGASTSKDAELNEFDYEEESEIKMESPNSSDEDSNEEPKYIKSFVVTPNYSHLFDLQRMSQTNNSSWSGQFNYNSSPFSLK